MTVKELINRLENMPKDKKVVLEYDDYETAEVKNVDIDDNYIDEYVIISNYY